ncbi:MAG: sodium/proline symporter [Polyangiales bacterium]
MVATMAVFVLSLLAFTALGFASSFVRERTTEDYLLAGRQVPAWLTALSSAATNNSGFMFIGLIGFAYRFGVQAIWLQLGWIAGDWVAWTWVHGRVRKVSAEVGACSTPALIATSDAGRFVRSTSVVAGALTFIFLGGYAAAQFKAGSTALQALFGWDLTIGATVGAIIVLVYCFSGGLRASIWTDAAQAFVMIAAMAAIFVAAWNRVGDPAALWRQLAQTDPALTDWFPSNLALGFGLYVMGFTFGGFGVVGQPHILARSMAIESADAIPTARKIYFAWFVPFSALAVMVGLYSRVLLPELAAGAQSGASIAAHKAELAFPQMALALLPDGVVGLVLAGLFSATMSTADSQVIACSAAITQDIAPQWRSSYVASKAATTFITVLALVLALSAAEGVFDLVLSAWSALGASLGPLVLLRVFGRRVEPALALIMMASGLATVWWWQSSSYSADVFKLLPGMLVPLVIYAVAQAVGPRRLSSRRRST